VDGANVTVSQATANHLASSPIEVLILVALLSVLPGALLAMTGFTRILIVLGFVRNALGTPQMPPTQILVGLAFFLSLFVMSPTLSAVNKDAINPYRHGTITQQQAITRGLEPIRTFMFKQTRDSDLSLFLNLAHEKTPKTRADVPTQVLVPAFVISELKTAFQIGFLLFIPFVIIDLVVASVLMSMGMMMLSPVLISLPFKLMLFVMVDGWTLVMGSLASSFYH
jgi:flagellar biosynthesis protein FliP